MRQSHFTYTGRRLPNICRIANIYGRHAFGDTFDHTGQGLTGANFDEDGDACRGKVLDSTCPLYWGSYLLSQLSADSLLLSKWCSGNIANHGKISIVYGSGGDDLRKTTGSRLHNGRMKS